MATKSKATVGLCRMGILVVALTVVCTGVAQAAADWIFQSQKVTAETLIQWMSKYRDAKPDFKPGDVLTVKDLPRLVPFIPPGYIEMLNFPELHIEVWPTRHHPMRADFMECTEKFQNQVRLKPDGAMENYVCGQPFPVSTLDPNDPMSGIKAAWDFEYRWQNYGLAVKNGFAVWDRFDGNHDGFTLTTEDPPAEWNVGVKWTSETPTDVTYLLKGGGNFQRTLQWFHQRVYFTHLPQEAIHGYILPVPNAKVFEFKEITGFYSPFDIRGTAFIIYRYDDPYRPDDAWAYIPTLRRVRRISAEVKSDTLLGSDASLDEFYGFSDHELNWKWKFLGFKDILMPMEPRGDYTRSYGPNGMVPDTGWQLRKAAVTQRFPKDPRHPMSSVVNFWDAEDWIALIHHDFDQKGKLWRMIQWEGTYTENAKNFAEINHGVKAMHWDHGYCIDVQNNRGTLWFGLGDGNPSVTAGHVVSLYDINRLEQIHR